MRKLVLLFSILFSVSLTAQVFVIEDGVTVNTCSGTFVDTGGATGSYSGNESITYVICPETAGQLVQLDFTAFATQAGADVMAIYNADDALDATTLFGNFSGTTAASSPGFVSATQDNVSGCVTIVFTSSGGVNDTGWVADISCFEPCQTIVSVLDSSSPESNEDGFIQVCPNEEITLTGSGQFSTSGDGATYEWDLGDGTTQTGQTAVFSYDTPGVYLVNLDITDTNTSVDEGGCKNTNLINQVIQVALPTDFTGTAATDSTICFGDSTTINGVANVVPFLNECTPPESEVTFLPDGSGAVYETEIIVDCFESDQTLDDINQLIEICLVMEHSYLGDLDIEIISPTGELVRLHDQGGGSANLGIPWATAGVDGQSNILTPGVGFQYCFVPGNAFPTLVDGIQPDETFVSGDGPATYTDSFVPEGTYSSVNSLNGLIGSSLNGSWTIRITDNIGQDNGYIFSWVLNFDPTIQPPDLSFTPTMVSESWDDDSSIINTEGNTITVQPSAEGVFCYTYRALDDFGCEYSEEVCIEVTPELVYAAPDDLFVCNTGTAFGVFDLTENDAIIYAPTTNQGDFVLTYHETQANADADSNPISAADVVAFSGTDGQIIYARFEYKTSGCYETVSFTLNLLDQPLIFLPTDMVVCDDISNDGSEPFDLSSQTLDILGTQLPENYSVSYYISFEDADAGTNNLSSPYDNISSPEPIYVRVEANAGAGCYIADVNPVFNLVVNHKANASGLTNLQTCDDDLDGFMTFDLEQQTTLVLGDQIDSDFTVTYHETQVDADSGSNPLTSPFTNTIANQQTIFTRVEEIGLEACYETTQFDVIVNPLPSTVTMTALPICDDDADGLGLFTLTTKDTEALNGQTGIAVSYHETQGDADTNTSPLASPYTNINANSQIVIIRLENTTTNCFSTMPLELRVNPLPIANAIGTQTICDDDYDGLATFDFTGIDLTVIGTQLEMVVSYHETQGDADTNSSPVTTPYTSINPDAQTLFIRLENTTTGCFDTTTLELLVDPLPVVPTITDYELCDDTNAGDLQELFDLSTKDTEIINGQNVSVTYYETETDATNNINELTGLYQNTSSPQTLHVALTDLTTGCRITGSFTLIVNPLPSTVTMTALPICDDDADGLGLFTLTTKDTEALNGQTGIAVSYHETQGDADTNTSPLASPYTNINANSQIVIIRLENTTTNCFSTMPLELRVNPLPIANAIGTQTICDDDYDGLATFDFTGIDLTVIGTQLEMVVSYHETQGDADTNSSPVTTPYTSINPDAQTLFIRLENTTTGCFDTTTLELLVDPLPVVPTITDYELCDDTNAGDLQELFDLSTKDTEIINGQNVSVTYYETETDATNNINELTGLYQNTSSPQTLHVALTDLTTGCRITGSFTLIVNPLPSTVTMTALPICDDDADGLGLFTLTTKDTEALNGQTGIAVSYHETQGDADTNTSPLASPYTNINANSQIVIIRLENTTTNCFSTMPLELRVNPLPIANAIGTQTICDDDYDGLATFDFTGIDLTVIGTQLEMVVSYHETQGDADTNSSPVTTPYTSINPDAQTLFIRLENTTTGCFDTTTLELLVDPLPVVPTITDYELCDDTNAGDLQELFDLSTKDTEIINGQNVSVTYYETETDATNNINELTGLYQNTSSPQTLHVALTDLTTGCRITGSFTLIVNPLPSTVTMTALPICDDDADGLGLFTLTTKDTEALNGQTGIAVSYHETQGDADTNTSPLASPYTNINANSQIVIIRLENTTTNCFSTMPLELRVNPLPIANAIGTQTICDDDYDGLATFDFTGIDLTVIGTQLEMVVSYHETQGDADTNSSPVTTPYTSINPDAQTLFIRLENTTTGCFDTTTLELLVDPLPVVPTITDYELCDDTNAGDLQELFDLSTKDTEIINGQNVSVTYYETETDATNNINELTGLYQNTSSPQTLHVALTDLTTGCRITGSFTLIVNPLPQLVVPTELEICDDGTPDGFTQIDLTDKDGEIQNGNTNYSITYYLTQLDADSETNPLVSPYTNISNPQTVIARGQDINTGCFTTVALDLKVSPSPEAIIPQDLTNCDPDSDGFGVFMLTDKDLEISNGVAGITISYHETMSDAENEVNALSSPYNNIQVDTQTVFARIVNPTITTLCATIVELVLVVNPTPQLFDPTSLEVCDDDADEFAQFNLTTKADEFLDLVPASEVTIGYYETQVDAQNETFEIVTPADYTNLSNPQTVWIRVAYNATGCEKITSLELIVNPLPVLVDPSPLLLCDDNAPGDEQEAFTLEDREGQILNGQTGLDFSYHLTQLDAEANSSPLSSPYTNISNPQTVFVRVSNQVTGCYDFTSLTLEVLPIPVPQTPANIDLCDDNASGNGQEVFDLTQNETFLLDGELGVTPTYHETLTDAEAGTNPIQFPDTYTNTNIPIQTIYVRVTNDITGCFAIVDFDVIVNPLPEANPVATLIACELNTDGIYAFDLEVQTDLIRGAQSASEFLVTYYETSSDATQGINPLTSPYMNTSNPQTLYVNVLNTITRCQNTTIEFNLEVLEAAQATSPDEPFALCDDNVETDNDPTNDSVLFDLTTQDSFVLNGQDPTNYLVRYFASQIDADLDQFELPSFYQNTVNPQVIFARVDNNTQIIDATGTLVDSSVCYETAPLILKVNPLPYIDIDDEYVLCVDTNGTEVLGPLEITTGLSNSDYIFIWRDDAGAVVETTSSYIPTEAGVYTLEVFDALLATQCAAPIEVFTVIESSPPTVTAVVTTQAFADTHIVEVTATGLGDYEYNIDQGPWQDTGIFVGVNPGERVVNVRDLNGCGVGQAVVFIIDYPKYFTPNGDGYHDSWNILSVSNQLSAKIQIFDRYGKLLKEIRPSSDGWDGTYNGAMLPSSDYWFVLYYNEPVTGEPTLLNAHFTLKR